MPECPDCGTEHRRLSGLPDHPISVGTLESLEDNDSIRYTGPTAINAEMQSPMVVIGTAAKVTVASYYEDIGWLVTFEIERENVDQEDGMLVNEMASQCIEAGYHCVEQWQDDGEPGARLPEGLDD